MRRLLTEAARTAKRPTPAAIATTAAALSVGAYSVHATVSGQRAHRHTFTLVLPKRALTLGPGSSARLAIAIRRRGLPARIGFSLIRRPGRGISVRFTPAHTRGRRVIVTLRVSTQAKLGRHHLRLQARAGHVHRTIVLTVIVAVPHGVTAAGPTSSTQTPTGQAADFSMSGSAAAPLEPGLPQPIDVVITNSNDVPLTLSSLTVTVQAITAPHSTASLPCSQSDFSEQAYSGPLALTIPAQSRRSLSDLGVASSQWPALSLADRPFKQDGCENASLSLSYSAEARLG